MTYINPAFRERQKPIALLPGAVAPNVIEVQARDVTPTPTRTQRGGRHAAYFASLSFPVAFAVMAYMFGDLRLCAIFCLLGLFMGLVGLYTLDG